MEQLIVSISANRETFVMEDYMDSDDIFALTARGSFHVETAGQTFTVKEGEGVLFRKNVRYHKQVITPVRLHLFRYDSPVPLFKSDHIYFKDQNRIASTMKMLDMLETNIFRDDFEKRRHLFHDIVTQYEIENSLDSGADPLIEQAVVEIKNTFQNGVNLYEIGRRSGLSYVQFLRRFKACTGCSPSEYVIGIKLQKAKVLLGNPELQIKQIASSCGFENEYYFSNFFKKHTALSPSAFRKSLSVS